ncbi:MAG: ArsI/CadI family heavy metal resistance metalloenzyme [Cyclobacteriaceae bacterium]
MKKKSEFPRMHVSLYVSDIAKTVGFYDQFFNLPADKIAPGYAKYILNQPSLIISFVENADRVSSNFGHLGFQVETREQMDHYLKIAREKNIVSKEEIGTACCYALQDKFWVNDPDGMQWEVYYFHEDVAFNDPKFETENSEVCCVQPSVAEKQRVALSALQQNCEPGSGCC